MKHEELRSFMRDWARLNEAEQARFLEVLREDFLPACERFAQDPAAAWPQRLRVKPMQGTHGIWEMTWSFAGPDGRATFEWIEIDELTVRGRRIGGHAIFGAP